MKWSLELIAIPVSDVDRAKAFYSEQVGFRVDVDHSAGEDFRVVQLSPPGSACSIALMRSDTPGSLRGLQVVVSDIDAARAHLLEHGVDVSEVFHFTEKGQTPGHGPRRADYESFISFSDPDGNHWMIQEVPSRG